MTRDRCNTTSSGNELEPDPNITDQIEKSLVGVHRFNAATAKYGAVWIWLLRILTTVLIGASLVSVVTGLVLLVSGSDIDFGTKEMDAIEQHTWPLWISASVGFTAGSWFFGSVWKGISLAQEMSEAMAAENRTPNKN